MPCWLLLHAGQHWPLPVTPAGTALFALGLIGMPLAMVRGHGRRQQDWAAIVGDTLLGTIWVLFTWSVVLGVLLRLALTVTGVGDGQDRARIVTWAVLGAAAVLLAWGYAEARRVPRVRRLDVQLPRLGAGLDGTRVVLVTDTHYGPLDRARWSARVCETVNTLNADLVCHTGDIADGTAERRRAQATPLGTVHATRARVYVTGNHEYYSEAQGWVDLMDELGWEPLRNRHLLLERGGDTLVVAGVDDVTAESSGLAATAPTSPEPCTAPTPTTPSCSWPTSPSSSTRRQPPASTSNSPATPTAARSGPSTTWSASTSPPSPASATTAPAPSSTPAAAPASGARRSASSPRARSPCSYSAPHSGPLAVALGGPAVQPEMLPLDGLAPLTRRRSWQTTRPRK